MGTALIQEKIYTIADIYGLPDGERAELVDGHMYMMAPPNTRHQEISGELFRQISNDIVEKGGKCKVFAAPFAVFLNCDDKNYLEPDISVICDKSKLDEKGCSGAPDWVIEIVSPQSSRMDYFIKLFKYQAAGVREYWIVDAKDSSVTVYDFDRKDMNRYTFADSIKVGIYEDFEIDFSKLI